MERAILNLVLSLHFLCLIFAWPLKNSLPSQKPSKIAVTTKILQPQKKEIVQTSTAKKNQQVKSKTAKKPAPKSLPSNSKAAPNTLPKASKASELLKESESNITTIESNLKNIQEAKPLTITPIQIENWEENTSPTNSEEDYFETISAIFRQSLTLPESGAVKVTITVQPNGEIVNIEPVLTESDANFRYLENTLPHLRLPAPSGASNVSITITFCEEHRLR